MQGLWEGHSADVSPWLNGKCEYDRSGGPVRVQGHLGVLESLPVQHKVGLYLPAYRPVAEHVGK